MSAHDDDKDKARDLSQAPTYTPFDYACLHDIFTLLDAFSQRQFSFISPDASLSAAVKVFQPSLRL
jgi:hypothetical protein